MRNLFLFIVDERSSNTNNAHLLVRVVIITYITQNGFLNSSSSTSSLQCTFSIYLNKTTHFYVYTRRRNIVI